MALTANGKWVVQPGESWESIAKQVYGNQQMAQAIKDYNATYNQVDPNFPIQPGEVLLLPKQLPHIEIKNEENPWLAYLKETDIKPVTGI